MREKELPKILVEALACPKCKGSLEYRKKEARLLCRGCGLVFMAEGGIPILLASEAEKL